MTLAGLRKRLKESRVVKCLKKQIHEDYEARRQGHSKLVEVEHGYFLPQRVIGKLCYFPQDARVSFTPPVFDGWLFRGDESLYLYVSEEEQDPVKNKDLCITWMTAKGISLYRFHMIPDWAIKAALSTETR